MQKLTTQTAKGGIEKSPAAATSAEHVTVAIAAILFQVDPCHINFGENTGEYIVEAECIASKLKRCQSVIQIKNVINNTLTRYFSENWGFYNRNNKKSVLLDSMARQIWELKNN